MNKEKVIELKEEVLRLSGKSFGDILHALLDTKKKGESLDIDSENYDESRDNLSKMEREYLYILCKNCSLYSFDNSIDSKDFKEFRNLLESDSKGALYFDIDWFYENVSKIPCENFINDLRFYHDLMFEAIWMRSYLFDKIVNKLRSTGIDICDCDILKLNDGCFRLGNLWGYVTFIGDYDWSKGRLFQMGLHISHSCSEKEANSIQNSLYNLMLDLCGLCIKDVIVWKPENDKDKKGIFFDRRAKFYFNQQYQMLLLMNIFNARPVKNRLSEIFV